MTMSADTGRGDQGRDYRLLRLDEVAGVLSVSVRSVHRLIAGGDLPRPVRVGGCSRLPLDEVHAYIEGLKQRRAGR
jgi:excisionase family DNA binding protein